MLGQYRILYKQQFLFDGFLLTRCDALRGKAHLNLPAWFVFGVQSSATTTLGMPLLRQDQSAQYHEASHTNLTEISQFSSCDALLRCDTPTVRSKELCNEINVFMSDGFRLVCIPPFTQAGPKPPKVTNHQNVHASVDTGACIVFNQHNQRLCRLRMTKTASVHRTC